MADSIFEAGKISQVFVPAGRKDNGEPRYRLAPYEVIEWSSANGLTPVTYVVPCGFAGITDQDINLKLDGSAQVGMEFGYYTQNNYVVEPHEGDGKTDSWKSLHAFGPL